MKKVLYTHITKASALVLLVGSFVLLSLFATDWATPSQSTFAQTVPDPPTAPERVPGDPPTLQETATPSSVPLPAEEGEDDSNSGESSDTSSDTPQDEAIATPTLTATPETVSNADDAENTPEDQAVARTENTQASSTNRSGASSQTRTIHKRLLPMVQIERATKVMQAWLSAVNTTITSVPVDNTDVASQEKPQVNRLLASTLHIQRVTAVMQMWLNFLAPYPAAVSEGQ